MISTFHYNLIHYLLSHLQNLKFYCLNNTLHIFTTTTSYPSIEPSIELQIPLPQPIPHISSAIAQSNVHPMTIRSKYGIFKLKLYTVTLIFKEPDSGYEAIQDLK